MSPELNKTGGATVSKSRAGHETKNPPGIEPSGFRKESGGGPNEDRTHDLRIANAALSQLSYRPESSDRFYIRTMGWRIFGSDPDAGCGRLKLARRRLPPGAGGRQPPPSQHPVAVPRRRSDRHRHDPCRAVRRRDRGHRRPGRPA